MDRRWFLAPAFVLAFAAQGALAEDTLVSATDPPCGEVALGAAPALQICDSGGDGASSCETKWTVNISGWGWPSGCGISCADGYYACCTNPSWYRNATCSCVEDPREPVPWSPEQPGL